MSDNDTSHNFTCLLTDNWEKKIDQWLDEDVPSFDYGGFVVGKIFD